MSARAVALILLVLCTLDAAGAQTPADNLADGRSGKIYFSSVTPTGPFNFVKGAAARRANIFGTLVLPAGNNRLPAVVIAHGSAGVTTRETRWTELLVAAGYAAFVVDSFTPRGVRSTESDQSKVPTAANAADALAALKLLATHPRIDPQRIGVLGFSKGGQVALYTALEPYRATVLKDSGIKFAAHVALYPYCNDWQVSERLTGAPLLMLLGGSDNYTPPEPCRGYADWFRSKGAEVEVKTYPGAFHGFDSRNRPFHVANVVTGKNCSDTIDVDHMTVTVRPSGEDVTENSAAYFRKCMTRGATIGGDSRAREQAPRDVLAFLKRVFGN